MRRVVIAEIKRFTVGMPNPTDRHKDVLHGAHLDFCYYSLSIGGSRLARHQLRLATI